jgi:glutamyl-tRNA reductase
MTPSIVELNAAACIRLIEKRCAGDLSERNVLLIGAGAMIEHVAAEIAARRPQAIVITSRIEAHAASLAARFGAQTLAWELMPSNLGEFDLVVSCAGGALPILTLGMVARALQWRDLRPMLMFDLAAARDIAPEVACLQGAGLHRIGASQRRAPVAGAIDATAAPRQAP